MATQNIRSVARAMDILDVIQKKDGAVGVTEIASEIGLAKSTVYRILETLLERNMLRKNETSGSYSLGYKVMELAFSAATNWDLVNLAMPYLEELRDKFNETTALAIKVGLSYCYVAEAVSHQEFRVNPSLGRQYPLHWAGAGKAILAYIPTNERDEILKIAPNSRATPLTITDPIKLLDQLDQIHKDGYAISYSERAEGAGVIAAPVCDKNNFAQASICLVGPEVRLRRIDQQAIGFAVAETGRKVEMVYRSVGFTRSNI